MNAPNLSKIYNIVFGASQAPKPNTNYQKLPKTTLDKIKPITKKQLKAFAEKYPINPDIAKLFFGEEFQVKSLDIFKSEAQENFRKLTESRPHPDLDFNKYFKCYQICLLTLPGFSDKFVTPASLKSQSEKYSENLAFRMLVLFDGDLKSIEKVIKQTPESLRNVFFKALPPLYDSKLDSEDLQTLSVIDLEGWQKLIKTSGTDLEKCISIFSSPADRAKFTINGKAPSIEEILLPETYDYRAAENIELAKICKINGVSAYEFEHALDWVNSDIMHDLRAINDQSKIKALISDGYNCIYKIYGIRPSYFDNMDLKEIQFITNLTYSNLYAIFRKYGRYSDDESEIDSVSVLAYFKDIDIKKISTLTSSYAMEVYKLSGLDPHYFKDIELDYLQTLFSYWAIDVYKKFVPKPEDLQALFVLPLEKIKALVSWDAIEIYEKCGITPNDFINLDTEKTQVLLSSNALEVYKTCNLTPEYFINMDTERIIALTSDSAVEIYERNKEYNIRPQDFEGIQELEKIKALTSIGEYDILYHYLKPSDFVGIDTDHVELLTDSWYSGIFTTYFSRISGNYIKPIYFRDIPLDKVKALCDPRTQEIYKKYSIMPDHLERLEAKTIIALTSDQATDMYQKHKIKSDQLKDIIHTIQDGTSFDEITEMVREKTETPVVISLQHHSIEQVEILMLGDHNHTDWSE
jgi:hypothetical protein